MAKIRLNKMLNFTITDAIYQESSRVKSLIDSKNSVSRTVIGTYKEFYRPLVNKVYSFSYYLANSLPKEYLKQIQTVNTFPVYMLGVKYLPHTLLLRQVSQIPTIALIETGKDSDLKERRCFKISLEIEAAIQRPLYAVEYLKTDYYFKDPKGIRRHTQFCSEPNTYINNSNQYPNAVHISNGLGFYSDDRPEFNVLDPVLLDADDHILASDVDPVYVPKFLNAESNWNSFYIPRS